MRRRALTIAFAVAVIAIGSGASAAAATRIERSSQSVSAQSDLIALINGYRSTHGLQDVSPNGALTGAAAWMAADMAAKNYMGHVSSDGRSPTQRMSAFGYPTTSHYTGEDLGAGYETASSVLAGWLASAAHNAVLLNPNFDAVGVGLVYNPGSTYKWYWAADFGGAGGAVKFVISSPPPQAVARAMSSPAPEAPTVAELQPAAETTDPQTLAQAARIASLDAKRIAHLLALLQRMGEI